MSRVVLRVLLELLADAAIAGVLLSRSIAEPPEHELGQSTPPLSRDDRIASRSNVPINEPTVMLLHGSSRRAAVRRSGFQRVMTNTRPREPHDDPREATSQPRVGAAGVSCRMSDLFPPELLATPERHMPPWCRKTLSSERRVERNDRAGLVKPARARSLVTKPVAAIPAGQLTIARREAASAIAAALAIDLSAQPQSPVA